MSSSSSSSSDCDQSTDDQSLTSDESLSARWRVEPRCACRRRRSTSTASWARIHSLRSTWSCTIIGTRLDCCRHSGGTGMYFLNDGSRTSLTTLVSCGCLLALSPRTLWCATPTFTHSRDSAHSNELVYSTYGVVHKPWRNMHALYSKSIERSNSSGKDWFRAFDHCSAVKGGHTLNGWTLSMFNMAAASFLKLQSWLFDLRKKFSTFYASPDIQT